MPNFTLAQRTTMEEMRKAGKSYRDIAKALDLSQTSVYYALKTLEASSTPEVTEKVVIKKEKLTPIEMIQSLWDMGYRIKNNKLVLVTVQEIKLADIIKNKDA